MLTDFKEYTLILSTAWSATVGYLVDFYKIICNISFNNDLRQMTTFRCCAFLELRHQNCRDIMLTSG